MDEDDVCFLGFCGQASALELVVWIIWFLLHDYFFWLYFFGDFLGGGTRFSMGHRPPIYVTFLFPYPSLLFIVQCTHSWVCQALGISLRTHRPHFYWHACFFLVLGSEPLNFGYQQIVNQTWYKIKPIFFFFFFKRNWVSFVYIKVWWTKFVFCDASPSKPCMSYRFIRAKLNHIHLK